MTATDKANSEEAQGDVNPAPGPGETSAGDAPVESVVDADLQDMGQALAAADQELAAHREAMLRMQAEMENLRKRLIRDLEKSRKFALEGVMKDLLQVRDSLERGLQMIDESTSVESLKAGKELTLRMLSKVMADHGLEVVDPAGEAFNPEFHEAVTLVPAADRPENTVIEVLQKGFKLHDRLLRPAMVVVSSGK